MRGLIMVACAAVISTTACTEKAPSPKEIFVAKALQSARDSMKDPTTVKFKDVLIDVENKCMVGEVLGKNGYGAYAGYRKFAWIDGEMYVYEPDPIDGTDSMIAYAEHSLKCQNGMIKNNSENVISMHEA